MANYLRNRKQYVVFNNHNSEITDITCGVPQGSILGPLFFSICINDLKNASNKCKFLMYADDTTIYFNIEDFNTNNLEAEINKELEQVNTWLKVNKLSQGLRFPLARSPEASETQLGRVKAICDLARLASGIIVVI